LREKVIPTADIKNRFAFVIPAYNHGATVVQVIKQALATGFPVFLVDDGSTDDTAQLINGIPNLQVIRHKNNLGKGAALTNGFTAAAVNSDWAITIDADGQHYPEDAMSMIAAIPRGVRPIVVGVRANMTEEHVPWTSRFGRKFSNFWVRMSGGPALADSQSGMRVYPLPEVIVLPTKAQRFQFEVEVLVQAKRKGLPVLEVPVRVDYNPGGERISHFRPFVDFVRNALTFTRLIFTRIFSRR